jgi:hypothetical protein
MATRKQTQAAKRNVKKAQKAAADQKTIAHLPADTKSALGKQGAAVVQRKRTGDTSPKTRAELYEIAKARPARQVENGPGRTGPEARREIAANAWFHGKASPCPRAVQISRQPVAVQG